MENVERADCGERRVTGYPGIEGSIDAAANLRPECDLDERDENQNDDKRSESGGFSPRYIGMSDG